MFNEPDTTTTTTTTEATNGTSTRTADQQAVEILRDTTTVEATAVAEGTAQPLTDATPQQFAQPELTTFEAQGAEATAPGTGTGSSSRRRRPREDPDGQRDDEAIRAVFGTQADDFDSGILSGQEAAAQSLDDLRF